MSICRSFIDGSPHLLPPRYPRQKTQIVQADRRGLAPAGQPLQHLRREVGQPQLSADMPLGQPHGLGQFLNGGELTGLHASSPTLSRWPDQVPRYAGRGPRTLAPPSGGGAETAPAFQQGQLPMLDRQIQRRAIRFSWKNPTPRFATPVAPKSGIILSQLVDHFGGGTPTNG